MYRSSYHIIRGHAPFLFKYIHCFISNLEWFALPWIFHWIKLEVEITIKYNQDRMNHSNNFDIDME